MNTPLAMTLLAVGLALAVWLAGQAALRRPANAAQIVAAGLLTLGLVVQSVISWVRLSRLPTGDGPAEPATFVAYSIGVLLMLPAGIWVARLERTRWGSFALGVTALVAAVMTLRLHQLWADHG